MKNIILFGPPGSGKGTQATMLADRFNLIHISTGDLFRYEMGNDTPLGLKAKEYISEGALVPDEITIGMLQNKVENHPDADGFIFDGFPRTIPQAEALDTFLEQKEMSLSSLISLTVEDEEIVSRILERGKTSGRKDDQSRETIQNRIDVYKEKTKEVYDYYDEQCLAQEINGMGTIMDIHQRLSEIVAAL